MDRQYRPADRNRDRDRDHDRDQDRENYRDRQPRRQSRFSDGPPSDHRISPRGGFSSDGGAPPYLPPPDHRRSPRGGFSDHRRSPREGFSDHRRSPRGGFSSDGRSPRGGFSSGGRSPRGGFSSGGRSPRGGFSSSGRAYGSPPRQQPNSGPSGDYRPMLSGPPEQLWPISGNGVGSEFKSGFTAQRPPFQPPQRPLFQPPPVNYQPPPQLSGQKRGFSGCNSPASCRAKRSAASMGTRTTQEIKKNHDARNAVKLFVGSVPRTATEEEIRPLFEEQGMVLEIAFIKDKRTGQQQGCCFIKYASSEEADKAIRALHNQYTLPGGVGPIQVRYADGERERIGNVEYKLFVGGMNKYATEKEVEEIFISYGCMEDVYLMRDERGQSRGCGFIKFSSKESATAAVNTLNGIYTMRGCVQPLTVRFAEPKRPRAGEPRAGPAFGGPGFGPSQSPGIRPPPGPNFPDPKVGQGPPNAWQPWSPQNMGPSANAGIQGFGNQFPPRSGEAPNSSIPGGHIALQGSFREGSFVGSVPASSMSLQVPPSAPQISPLQKPVESPQFFPPSLELHQGPGSYSQPPISQPSMRPPIQLQSSQYGQPFQSQQVQSLPGQYPSAHFQAQQSTTSVTAHSQPNTTSSVTNSQLATSGPQQPLSFQQSPSQLAQMLSQQTQTLQATFQSSQQAFSQLQQQVQMMRPSTQNQPLQQSFQPSMQQSQWPGAVPTSAAGTPYVGPTTGLPPTTQLSAAKPTHPKCNWTEHTSPDGHKYYYNSTTGESKWDKPEELTLFEQQKTVVPPTQQVTQSQPPQLQTQFRSDHMQHPPLSSMYPVARDQGNQSAQEKTYSQSLTPENSVKDPARFQQGFPPMQNWSWNNS